jgi:hypothetical protein
MAADKRATIAPGMVFELEDGPGIGEGEHSIQPGALVSVLDVVERGTPGVGRSESEQVIVVYRYYGLPTRDADGEYVYLEHARCLAIPIRTFSERFAPSEKDPTPRKPVA